MEAFIQFFINHANAEIFGLSWAAITPFLFFFLILLAGFGLPFSIDIIGICAAFLAASVMPEQKYTLFFTFYFGTLISAWIAFYVGKGLQGSLSKRNFFKRLLPEKRLEKMKSFYSRYGLLTLIIGRFIPFGFRNALFMSTGMSGASFISFALRDALASLTWCTLFFSLFYYLSEDYHYFYKQCRLFGAALLALLLLILLISWLFSNLKKKRLKEKTA